jgi:hypothetical protein
MKALPTANRVLLIKFSSSELAKVIFEIDYEADLVG